MLTSAVLLRNFALSTTWNNIPLVGTVWDYSCKRAKVTQKEFEIQNDRENIFIESVKSNSNPYNMYKTEVVNVWLPFRRTDHPNLTMTTRLLSVFTNHFVIFNTRILYSVSIGQQAMVFSDKVGLLDSFPRSRCVMKPTRMRRDASFINLSSLTCYTDAKNC